ncbi:8-amino-7-oxononanoate synthase [Candidatus Litorirhabdus singularis]|uniref:8-amino-7-oxononanoate synthase n=1 Tax=Candidatus Litorirhabdus singularis TaxID=2518993 RepID=UPI00242E9FDE|nr:8-amino-7-oxononanoate synthase [Candidatus Litorirhabdus singularis]
MNALQLRLQQRLQERRQQSLYRQRLTLSSPQGAEVQIGTERLLCFCSNDYLGLANHPQVITSLQENAARYGVGSGASHLVVGHSGPHQELEEALAEFTGRPRALLFSSGYMANIGIMAALLKRGDAVFEDRLNHASLLDGGLLSGARLQRFRHNDTDHLKQLLQQRADVEGKLVATDGVFSMDGDSAPLGELATVCAEQGALLVVDDAHGFGVLGANGAGSLEQAGLSAREVPVLMGTLGKALGTGGAFVAGDEDLIEGLIQFARSYIYTTAIPPALVAATLVSLELLTTEAWRRPHLQQLIARFRAGAEQLGLPLMDSQSPIQPLLVGDADAALRLSEKLRSDGVLVSAIRPPTVHAGTARLRITLSAAHNEDQVDRLLDALQRHA